MTNRKNLRLWCSEDDYNQIAAIYSASQEADHQLANVSAVDMRDRLSQVPHFDIRRDLVIAEADGQEVGYGRVQWLENPLCRAYGLTMFIRPAWRESSIGHSVLAWLEERAMTIDGAQNTSTDSSLQINATQSQDWLHRLAQQAGFRVKESWVLMVRPNLEDIPDIPLPEGLETRPVSPEQYSSIWYAVEKAYVPEGGPAPSGIIPEDFRNDPNFQPELWQVAWEVSSAKVVGSVMTYINYAENKQSGIGRGYTEGISTVPEWQRRGVARALISRSLIAQRAAGMTESALICSGEKPDNFRLYESCGFQEVKRDTVYEKQLS